MTSKASGNGRATRVTTKRPKAGRAKATPAKAKPAKAKPAKAKATATTPKRAAKAKPTKAKRSSLEAIIATLGDTIGEPRPLTAEQLSAFEHAAGAALCPSLHALLSFDAGWMKREYGWFDDKMRLEAKPIAGVIEEHAGPFMEMYRPLLDARFAGKAIALDQGSDSMRLLYFGDPDARGEYPVLFIDHDDTPILGVEFATFEAWLASALGVDEHRDEEAAERRAVEILGVPFWGDEGIDVDESWLETGIPEPTPAPPPGSRTFATLAAPPLAKTTKLTDKQVDKALTEAAEDGDLARLGELIALATQRKRRAALDAAIVAAMRANRSAAVRALLAGGASANARGHYGCVLSEVAGSPDELELGRLLLAAGANPNGPSINGETVLHGAVENGSEAFVRLLLEAGADPNRASGNGSTPLAVACTAHASGADPAPSMIDVLCDGGADPNAGKQPVLIQAVEDGRSKHVAHLIARGANLEAVGWDGRRALHAAYAHGNDPLVRQLIAAGADRSAKDKDGISLEAIFGPDGEDIRPVDAHYVASEKPQKIFIEARIAVLNAPIIHTALPQLSMARTAELARAGHAAGAEFDPTKTQFDVVEDAKTDKIKKNGFVDLRWVLRVASVSPRFLRIVAGQLFAPVTQFTGAGHLTTVRAASLSVRGELQGKGLDGATLRAWLTDPDVQLGAYPGALPFAFETEASGEPGITIEAKDGKPRSNDFYRAITAWLAAAPLWPSLGFRIFLPQQPEKKRPNTYPIAVMDPMNPNGTHPLPFTGRAHVDALKNVMRVVHAKTPLARVVLVGPNP